MNEVAEKMEEQETQQDLDFGEDKPVQSPKANDAPFEVEIVDDRPEEDRVAKRNEAVQISCEGKRVEVLYFESCLCFPF